MIDAARKPDMVTAMGMEAKSHVYSPMLLR